MGRGLGQSPSLLFATRSNHVQNRLFVMTPIVSIVPIETRWWPLTLRRVLRSNTTKGQAHGETRTAKGQTRIGGGQGARVARWLATP